MDFGNGDFAPSLIACASRPSWQDGHVGCTALNGEWKAVEGATAAEKAAMRFFKVVVEVP